MASAQIHARPGNVLSQSPRFALMWRGCSQRCRAALEYAPRGIRINAVCPVTIETPMVADMIAKGELTTADAEAGQPIGRLGRGDEIAAACCGSAARAQAWSSALPCPSMAATPPAEPGRR